MSRNVDFNSLLEDAVNEPGSILAAYTAFHNYSLGNQMLAYFQCKDREIPVGPISTYKGWLEKGRQVQRGQKAITLCMPVTRKVAAKNETEEDRRWTQFVYKNNWFVLSQTEGPDVTLPAMPDWDTQTALDKLEITKVVFEGTDGNSQGYAKKREIAINPVAALPHKTLFHEMGHVMLGHTTESDMADTEKTPRDLREVEAESVALLCTEALGLDGSEFARGYIQHWLGEERKSIPEASAKKIFKVANQILEAGRKASD